jgi:hypothetical protein
MICIICIYTRAGAGEVRAIVNGQGVCSEHVPSAKQNDTLSDMLEFTRIIENPAYESDSPPPSLKEALREK